MNIILFIVSFSSLSEYMFICLLIYIFTHIYIHRYIHTLYSHEYYLQLDHELMKNGLECPEKLDKLGIFILLKIK